MQYASILAKHAVATKIFGMVNKNTSNGPVSSVISANEENAFSARRDSSLRVTAIAA